MRNLMPDDYVTNIQLIKTFVTALGGDAAAQSQGGYPVDI